jgi:hypothetical protein
MLAGFARHRQRKKREPRSCQAGSRCIQRQSSNKTRIAENICGPQGTSAVSSNQETNLTKFATISSALKALDLLRKPGAFLYLNKSQSSDEFYLHPFGNRLIAERKKLVALGEKIETLSRQIEREQADQRAKEYQAAVAKLPALMAGPAKAAEAVEAALVGIATAIEAYRESQRAALKRWPANVEKPLASEFGLGRLERVLDAAFRPFALSPTSAYYAGWPLAEKLQELRSEVRGFAKSESDTFDRIISELQHPAAPLPEVEKEGVAA